MIFWPCAEHIWLTDEFSSFSDISKEAIDFIPSSNSFVPGSRPNYAH